MHLIFIFTSAGIPVVDPDFNLLPIHFLVDPGPDFVWNRDELDPNIVNELEPDTNEKLQYIQDYLDLVKVSFKSVSHMLNEHLLKG